MKKRFDTEDNQLFKSLELFAIGSCTEENKFFDFYRKDLDRERLLSDRKMFFDVPKRSEMKVEKLEEIVEFLREK